MATDDELLLQQLMRTAQLIRRQRHAAFGPAGKGDCGGPRCEGGAFSAGGPHDGCRHPGHRRRHAQGRALALLAAHEGLSQKELASLMGVRPQSLSEMLLKLEEDGQVERRKSTTDGRVVNVYLTGNGRQAAAAAAELRRQSAHDVFTALDDGEKEELRRILSKLSAGLEHD